MTKYLISTFLFFMVMSGFAQDTTITWVNQEGKPVERDVATLVRHSWKESDSQWQVRDYFPKGELQMSGAYADKNLSVKHGVFRFFAANGTKISEGRYVNNVAEGFWNFWYDTGRLMDCGKFMTGLGDAERDSILKIVREINSVTLLRFPESLKDSTWEYFHENGERSGVEEYQSGLLTRAQYWNADGTEVPSDAVVNRMPQFPGGDKRLMKYLSKNITYPKAAKKKGIEGTVYIGFRIDREGNAGNFKVVRSVSPVLDDEALRIVRMMPRWQPAIIQNRFREVDYYLPVRFVLR